MECGSWSVVDPKSWISETQKASLKPVRNVPKQTVRAIGCFFVIHQARESVQNPSSRTSISSSDSSEI